MNGHDVHPMIYINLLVRAITLEININTNVSCKADMNLAALKGQDIDETSLTGTKILHIVLY